MKLDFSRVAVWRAIGIIAILVLALSVFGEPATAILRYDRAAVLHGEIWRLLSAHLVHLGWSHALLNLAGLALVGWLLAGEMSISQWAWVTLAGLIAIAAGFAWRHPEIEWYVGLSGMLHCWITAGALRRWLDGHTDGLILLGAVVLKGFYEQLVGPVPGSEIVSGGAVVVEAHWYGMLGGLVAVWAMRLRGRRTGV